MRVSKRALDCARLTENKYIKNKNTQLPTATEKCIKEFYIRMFSWLFNDA